jgi:hypothetical protein
LSLAGTPGRKTLFRLHFAPAPRRIDTIRFNVSQERTMIMQRWFALAGFTFTLAFLTTGTSAREKPATKLNLPPKGFTALFNGKDLTGWQGLAVAPETNEKKSRKIPLWLTKTPTDEAEKIQKLANEKVLPNWKVEDGVIYYDGKSNSLQSVKHFGNMELLIDWKIEALGDSGLYLRGNPQVQIWDINAKGNPKKVGSGGLYNNQKNPSNPLKTADNPAGQWNTFRIVMKGDKCTIWLNGVLVVDNTPLENYWHRGQPLPARGPIELQHHGDKLWFRNIFVKELPD